MKNFPLMRGAITLALTPLTLAIFLGLLLYTFAPFVTLPVSSGGIQFLQMMYTQIVGTIFAIFVIAASWLVTKMIVDTLYEAFKALWAGQY